MLHCFTKAISASDAFHDNAKSHLVIINDHDLVLNYSVIMTNARLFKPILVIDFLCDLTNLPPPTPTHHKLK